MGTRGNLVGSSARRSGLLLAACVTVALVAAIGAAVAARAQVDTPNTPDTELTPTGKRPIQWSVLGGAAYDGGGAMFPEDGPSPTPYTVNFFTTAFSPDYLENPVGFFGGAECVDPSTPFDQLEGCERQPSVYRFSFDDVGDPQIERQELPGGPGFVGSIAWIDGERALAVGGTGTYPRREPPAVPGGDDAYAAEDERSGAGMARAWLYEDGSWTEITELPEPMRGLSAVGCANVPSEYQFETPVEYRTCVAGGLQQLWFWRPGTEEAPEGFDPEPVTEVLNAAGVPDFHFRVRQVEASAQSNGGVTAATSGCCSSLLDAGDGAPPAARFLTYSNVGQWSSGPLAGGGEDVAARGALPDSYYGFVGEGGGTAVSSASGSAIMAPGGAAKDDEPGSRIVGLKAGTSGQVDPDPLDRKLDALRLVSAAGNFATTEGPANSSLNTTSQTGDGTLDWAVGRFKSGEQGVAYTTIPSLTPLPNPLSCQLSSQDLIGGNVSACEPEPSNVSGHSLDSRRLTAFPTYALNTVRFVPGVSGSIAWAAGDRGALARLGGGGGLGSESEPGTPELGTATPAVPSTSQFQAQQPSVSNEPGAVPSLAVQPLERMEHPALVPYGTPDPTRSADTSPPDVTFDHREGISSIAVSRDGAEGWAVGPGAPYNPFDNDFRADIFTLHHFDGTRWARCDVDGLGGAYAPDPACASLRPLLERQADGKPAPPTLSAIARIPFERDADPTNDDEFAAVAVGSNPDTSTVALAYRDGRWETDPAATAEIQVPNLQEFRSRNVQIAFVRPDDGWMITFDLSNSGQLYHYGGGDWPHGRWVSCSGFSPPPECGQGVQAVPTGIAGAHQQLQVAGESVFLAGERRVQFANTETYPFVARREPGGPWVREYDPGCLDPSAPGGCVPAAGPETKGTVDALSAVDLGGGRVAAWVLGRFGGSLPQTAAAVGTSNGSDDLTRPVLGPERVLIRRDPGSGQWAFRENDDAADAALPYMRTTRLGPRLVSTIGPDGGERAFILPGRDALEQKPSFPPLEYDAEGDRWRTLRAPFVSSHKFGFLQEATEGVVTAAAPDGRGGIWMTGVQPAVQGKGNEPNFPQRGTFYYRYADSRPRAVFEDAPSPVEGPISGMAGTSDGTVWVATESDRLYHYDRIGGWETINVPGWDRGRVVTRHSRAYAVAVNDSGTGIAVGEEGRIADVSPDAVALDPASRGRCSETQPPCGTPRDLRTAAVAPDGSAIAGGDRVTLTWRPAGGDFRLIDRPRVSLSETITGLSMPMPGRAWLTLENGEIWAGTSTGGAWRWERESRASAAADERRSTTYPEGRAALHAVAVDAGGRGIAVGDRGAILERAATGEWKRLETGFLDNLYSIALPPSGYGDGTLVGGGIGLILTRADGHFQVARPSDITDPVTTGTGQLYSSRIIGLTVSGGPADGDVESWAASQLPLTNPNPDRQPGPHALLHHSSGGDPLLEPTARAAALPDAPAPREGELTVAAFGRSECQLDRYCPEPAGNNLLNEVVSRRVASELSERRQSVAGPMVAAFTGDIWAMPGRSQNDKQTVVGVPTPNSPVDPNVVQDRWRELVAEDVLDDGVPLFAALGPRDLSSGSDCYLYVNCVDPQEAANAGASAPWRSAFASMHAPWGTDDAYSRDGVSYRPVDDGEVSAAGQTVPAKVDSPDGGARTHYALDVVRDGEPMARLVFIDDSFAHSLAASDPNQNPVEAGGQVAWLDRVLTRPEGVPAVVVENSPTYSYGPGALSDTQVDGSLLESILLRHQVTAVIAGRLGWNGLYYTLAPGVHWPCPGGVYPEGSPSASDATCVPAGDGLPSGQDAVDAANELINGTVGGAVPNVVASSAGGRFGPDGRATGSASDGFWHGYSVARIPADGDPAKVVVEQRPILDWVDLTAKAHALRAGKKLTLEGTGREPLGTDTTVQVNEIDSAAITHRYDLVEADPDQPWLPKEASDNGVQNQASTRLGESDPCGPYLCLDPKIGTVDEQSGAVKAGNGNYPRTYALAVLSVGSKTATWPLLFEPRASYRTKPAQPAAPVAVPPPPPAPAPPNPGSPAINLPSAPVIPVLTAQALAPPPVPPSPPTFASQAPLDLNLSPAALDVTPPTAVSQPPTPPVNPAPPGGARKEARQRQAAAQKSGADSDQEEGSGEALDGGDLAESPMSPKGAPMTRHDFTAIASREQPSAWARNALLGGGLGIAALILALGMGTARPTPRRRPPEVPAPAEARAWRRRF